MNYRRILMFCLCCVLLSHAGWSQTGTASSSVGAGSNSGAGSDSDVSPNSDTESDSTVKPDLPVDPDLEAKPHTQRIAGAKQGGPFGLSFFRRKQELPGPREISFAPSGYVLGTGDELKIIVWSDMSNETVYDVTVNPEGQVYIPMIGVLGVSGQTVGQFEEAALGALATKFKHFKGQVTLTRVRTIQVFVVGDVVSPGSHIVSGLSGAFSALQKAGGPTDKGSLRRIRVIRRRKTVSKIDFYQYLLYGDKSQDVRLENGDTIFVPPVFKRVTVEGEVLRPGQYEIADERNLAHVLEMAGGVEPSAYSRRVRVFRWRGSESKVTSDIEFSPNNDELLRFEVRNGDAIRVERASEEIGNEIILTGAVLRPGRYASSEGVTISSLIDLAGGIIKKDAAMHEGQIIRTLDSDRKQLIRFDLENALKKLPADDIELMPLDRVRVFAVGETRPDIRTVRIGGAVRQPGEYPLQEGMRLRDLILHAKGLTVDAAGDIEVAHVATSGKKSEIKKVDTNQVLKFPKSNDNVLLNPLDRVSILAKGDCLIQPETVVLTGEVMRPGPYSLRYRGEKLSEVIKRTGGFTPRAFLEGAIFLREVRKITNQNQLDTAERVQKELFKQANLDLQADLLRAGAKIQDISAPKTPAVPPEASAKQAMVWEAGGAAKLSQTNLAAEKETSKFGSIEMVSRSFEKEWVRIPIVLDEIMAGKARDGEDVALLDGDSVTVPVTPVTVSIVGAVVNPTTLLFVKGQKLGAYINKAGGFSKHSNHRKTVVVRANGEVIPLRHVRHIHRGDIVLVPPKPKLLRRDLLKESSQIAQILGNLAVVYKVALDVQ